MHCYKKRIDHSPAVHSPSSNQDQRAVQKCSSGTLHKLNPAKPASNCQVHQGLHCLASQRTCDRIKQKNFRTKLQNWLQAGHFFLQASASSSWLRFLWVTSVEKVVWAKASANATQSSTHCILATLITRAQTTQCLGTCSKQAFFWTLIAGQEVVKLSKGHFDSYFNIAVKKSSASLISSSEGPWSTTYFLRWLRSLATALESRSGLDSTCLYSSSDVAGSRCICCSKTLFSPNLWCGHAEILVSRKHKSILA